MIATLVLTAATGMLPLAAIPAAAAPAAAPVAAAMAVPAAAALAPMSGGSCSGATGVTVVVDFGSHDGTVVRCATGDPASAAQALQRAGFTQTRVQRQPAFVCRIDGVPTATEDACVVTPPADAYWALWTAAQGGIWKFASVGADLFDPKPGSVVGFAFGGGGRPRVAPPALAAPTHTSSARPARQGTASNDATASPAATSSPTTKATPGPRASTQTPASPKADATTPLPTASTPSPAANTGAPSAPASLAATPTASHPDDGAGGSAGAWVGVGAVAAIGAAALARARARTRLRRRR